ncbi:MAG: hypothetical protein WBK88_00885 [Methanothrix sp.]
MVHLGERRVDLIIREGGILDVQIESLRKERYGPGRARYLEEVLSARPLAICLLLGEGMGPGSRSAR